MIRDLANIDTTPGACGDFASPQWSGDDNQYKQWLIVQYKVDPSIRQAMYVAGAMRRMHNRPDCSVVGPHAVMFEQCLASFMRRQQEPTVVDEAA